ncbi:ABC transporter substrate-binding protein [Streptomyces sp. NPDC001661]
MTVDVLAYNATSIDPYVNSMVAGCSRAGVQLRHDPVDFAGQKQKTSTTLAARRGTYDLVETYSYAIPQYAAQHQLRPLDSLFAKYRERYRLDELDPKMLEGLRYDGKLYGLPMQANVQVFVYRKDVFRKLGLSAPKTFRDVRAAARQIRAKEHIKRPLALPLHSAADISTLYGNLMRSQGAAESVDPRTRKPTFDTSQSRRALGTLRSLAPYMDPQVTTFDQIKVQQQLFNGNAAMGLLYSGRAADLLDTRNTEFAKDFGFVTAPSLRTGGGPTADLSVDGWSIPWNTHVDPDLLFQLMAASVGRQASAHALPAAYPARRTAVDEARLPYARAVRNAIKRGASASEPYTWAAPIQARTSYVLASAVNGTLSVGAALRRCESEARAVLAGGQ